MDKKIVTKEEFHEDVGPKTLSFADEREEYEALLVKFDKQRQKALLRKIDLRLLPPLALLYLMSYMDRTNMGNAKLQNLEKDLHLTGQQYNWYLPGLEPAEGL